jgi:phenylpyruvate tautomerase
MPLIRIVTSAEAPGGVDGLLRELSALLARELGKPESYVMTCLEPRAAMTFGGTTEPACYIEVKNVGTLGPDLTKRLSAAITERVARATGVNSARLYIEFAESKGHHWGFDGGTFG